VSRRTQVLITTVLVGLAVGILSPIALAVVLAAGMLLAALVHRVVSQERGTSGEGPTLLLPALFVGGVGLLAGGFMGEFGVVLGLAALILLAVVLILAGAELT